MKRLINTAVATAFICLTACSTSENIRQLIDNTITFSGQQVSRQIDIKGFDAITASNGLTVTYSSSAKTAIRLSAPEDALQYINVSRKGSALAIEMKSGHNYSLKAGQIVIAVSSPEVKDFQASSSGCITIESLDAKNATCELKTSSSGVISTGRIKADKIKCVASSSGTINIGELTCSSLEATSSSSANINIAMSSSQTVSGKTSSSAIIRLTGTADNVWLGSSSSGVIDASGLFAKEGNATASSSSIIKCNVASLNSESSSSGIVKNIAK